MSASVVSASVVSASVVSAPCSRCEGSRSDSAASRRWTDARSPCEEGSITGLIGPNGSGKTTVFNMITGYLRADRGSVRFDGHDVRRPDPTRLYRRGLSRTFQQSRVFPQLTLVENLVVAVQHPFRQVARAAVGPQERARAQEILEGFGLASYGDRKASELSFGQRKLLEFATVLMGQPRLVLLDEPASGVNPVDGRGDRASHPRPERPGPHVPGGGARHEPGHASVRPHRGARSRDEDRGGRPADVRADPGVLDAYLGD